MRVSVYDSSTLHAPRTGPPTSVPDESRQAVATPAANYRAFEVTEDIRHAWFNAFADDDYLNSLKTCEHRAQLQGIAAGQALCPVLRDKVLRCLASLIEIKGMERHSWFRAVALLDRYCQSVSSNIPLEKIPSLCVVIVRLLLKVDHTQEYLCSEGGWNSATKDLNGWLQSIGVLVPELSDEILQEQERTTLRVLGWKVNVASVQQWCAVFCTRFEVLLGQLYLPTIQWVEAKIMLLARVIMMRQVSPAELSYGTMTMGLLGLSLVEAGLLPIDLLCPTGLPLAEWVAACLASWPNAITPFCILPMAHVNRLVELLQASTSSDMQGLKIGAQHVIVALGTALRDLHRQRREETLHHSI